jgi:hypothetical protein
MVFGAGGTAPGAGGVAAGTPLFSGIMYTDGLGAESWFAKTNVPSRAPPPTPATIAATMAVLRSDDEPPAATVSGLPMTFGRSIGP